jgi:hypothetical protein
MRSIGTLLVTLLFLAGLFLIDPFKPARLALIAAFRAGPESAKIEKYFEDPGTQETTHGENPYSSFCRLPALWSSRARRVYLIGNSQMFSVILAPNEQRTGSPEKTYPDFLFEQYRQKWGDALRFYRLAVPNISYMEALWLVHYLLSSPELRPSALIVQVNFETFRKTGIRDGFLDTLRNPAFREVIQQVAHGPEPYAGTFEQAIHRYEERTARRQVSRTGINQSRGFGNTMEQAVRRLLTGIPFLERRHQLKGSFLDTLYLARVDLLGVKPTTPRSIGGASLKLNQSSLVRIAELCRENRIHLALLNAPQNPQAPLYRTKDDKVAYDNLIRSIAGTYNLPLYDFENSIPAERWGIWIDGPDPIHFGREAHKMMANLVMSSKLIDNVTR